MKKNFNAQEKKKSCADIYECQLFKNFFLINDIRIHLSFLILFHKEQDILAYSRKNIIPE